MDEYLHDPVIPFQVDPEASVRDVLDRMGQLSFQGRNLSQAVRIWEEMLEGDVTIFFGLAGAMVPAGMRRLMMFLIEHRLIDCLVSTGGNLFHDCHETLGYLHWRGSPAVDDLALRREGIDRIYNTFAREDEFRQTDRYIGEFSLTLDRPRAYTTREFLHLLGRQLGEDTDGDGILTAAARVGLPIYCPAIADSSFGIALATYGRGEGGSILFDLVKDVEETARIVSKSESTGVIYVGGGTPKNFIQQTGVTASILNEEVDGHRYAVQITVDAPHWGGLSGCTLEEAQSWGKISAQAEKVTVYCDATIVLPLIVSALAQSERMIGRAERAPRFSVGGRDEEAADG